VKKGQTVHRTAASGKSIELNIYKVHEFLEKPADVMAQRVFSKGWLVNTMVLVGKAECFKVIQRTYARIVQAFLSCKSVSRYAKRNENNLGSI